MPVGRVLKRLGGADHFSFLEEAPGQVNRLRLAVHEADGKAHLRMACKVGDRQQLAGRWRDEDVQPGHQIFHFHHELGAGAHGADVFDGRNQAGGPERIWSASRSRGSGGLSSEARVPSAEHLFQFIVEDLRPRL